MHTLSSFLSFISSNYIYQPLQHCSGILQEIINNQIMNPCVLVLLLVWMGQRVSSSIVNTTAVYSELLGKNMTYTTWSGYQNISWYVDPSQGSVYYSLWQQYQSTTLTDETIPVIIWLQGGPGISSQFGAYVETGPLSIRKNSTKYTASQNQWSWNRFAHLIFVDQPIGTGLSYNKGKVVGDVSIATKHFVNFLYNLLNTNTVTKSLKKNNVYLGGEGIGSHFVLSFADAITANSSLGIKLKGVLIGGGLVDPEHQSNHYDSFLYSVGVNSRGWRDVTHMTANEAIVSLRKGDIAGYSSKINTVLDSKTSAAHYGGISVSNYRVYGSQASSDYVSFINARKKDLGVPNSVTFSEKNDGIKTAFSKDFGISYKKTLESLIKKSLKVLIYNGQNDVKVNTAGVLNYLQNIDWNEGQFWRRVEKQAWKEENRRVGWVKKHKNLIFCLLRNMGHHIYEQDQSSGKQTYYMVKNYFSNVW